MTALVNAVEFAAAPGRQAAELADASGEQAGQLAAMIGFDRRLYEHGGDVLAVLDQAVDIYAALCNIDVYRVLTEERGWSPDRVERWLHQTWCQLLLA